MTSPGIFCSSVFFIVSTATFERWHAAAAAGSLLTSHSAPAICARCVASRPMEEISPSLMAHKSPMPPLPSAETASPGAGSFFDTFTATRAGGGLTIFTTARPSSGSHLWT